jgi:hypothetical protein
MTELNSSNTNGILISLSNKPIKNSFDMPSQTPKQYERNYTRVAKIWTTPFKKSFDSSSKKRKKSFDFIALLIQLLSIIIG